MRKRVSALLATGALAVAGCGGQSHARVAVTPGRSLFDQPVQIVIHGVGPRRAISVELDSVDARRVHWSSQATFRADAAGTVDLDTSPSTGGSYAGIDGMGLIDALAAPGSPGGAYFWNLRRPLRFDVRVSEHHRTVATGSFLRSSVAAGVVIDRETIAATGFFGAYYRPPSVTSRRPAVLVLGGSEGGVGNPLLCDALASAGYPALCLAYFGEPGLPPLLRDIPLEYFARALRWLARRPGVLPGRVVISGVSRGSEAALLLGAHYPNLVHGVIATSPSDLAFGSFPVPGAAAWTYHGRPVPTSPSFSSTTQVRDRAAEIDVQRIRGPVLLACGTDDRVWTSCTYAGAIQRRLTDDHDRFPHALFRYLGAGHGVGSLLADEPDGSTPGSTLNGRSPAANPAAEAQLWPHVLRFLADDGVPSGTFTDPSVRTTDAGPPARRRAGA